MLVSPQPLRWLTPWEFSPTVAACCVAGLVLFVRGVLSESRRAQPVSRWRQFSFYAGVALIYTCLQTRVDFLAQHMFWIHRLQHLVLHHIAPMLIVLAVPWWLMASGLPEGCRGVVHKVVAGAPVRKTYELVQQPMIAFALFVGLIVFWLIPGIHFRAMLSAVEYEWMNWSMVIDGLLFWWLILDPRSRREGARIGFGARIAIVMIAMLPQLVIGAYLALNDRTLYDVYTVCGRLWPIDPLTDQREGGLITWIPASMMSVLAALIVLHRWMHDDAALHAERLIVRRVSDRSEVP